MKMRDSAISNLLIASQTPADNPMYCYICVEKYTHVDNYIDQYDGFSVGEKCSLAVTLYLGTAYCRTHVPKIIEKLEKLELKVWKTITIGGKSREQLFAALDTGGYRVGDWAKDIMAKVGFVITHEPRELDLVLATVAELGFPKDGTTREIWAKIKELGGSLCPPDLAPHLRLTYADQPSGEYLWVAMEQIAVSDGFPCVFQVRHDVGGRWLSGSGAHPSGGWNPGDRIVFVGPCK